MKAKDVSQIPDTEDIENLAESVFNCSVSTTSKAINIHVTGYERCDKTIADSVIDVVVQGFKDLTIKAARAKREADKQIEADIITENTKEEATGVK